MLKLDRTRTFWNGPVKYLALGIIGISCCWLPLCIAACRWAQGQMPFREVLKLEWEAWLWEVEKGVRNG